MQWMFVEMNNMKHEMSKMHKSIQQSNGNQNDQRNANDKSSLLGNNINSFNLGQSRRLSENQPLHQSSLFFAGNQNNDGNTNNRGFGGTRYNAGAQSMSVASQSIAQHAHSNNYIFNINHNDSRNHHDRDVLNQAAYIEESVQSNHSPSLPNQNLSSYQ